MMGVSKRRLKKIETASVDLLRSFIKFKDLKDFLNFICEEVAKALEVELCGIFRYEEERNAFPLEGGFGWSGSFTLEGDTHAHRCLKLKRPVSSEERLGPFGTVSLLAVPVFHMGKVWGVLGVYSKSKRSFSKEEVEFLKGVSTAITEYLEKESLAKELRKEKEFFQLIAEKAPVLIIIYREEFLYVNSYALKLFGYSQEEVSKMKVWEVVHPDFREAVMESVRRRISGDRTPVEYTDLPVRTKSGEYRYLRLHATTVKLKDGYAGLAVGIDVTREKELERKLKGEKRKLELILTHSHDVVSIVDPEGFVRYKSPSCVKVLGWRPEEVVGKRFSDFVHPEDAGKVESLRKLVFGSPGTVRTSEFRVRTKTGDYRWIEAIVFLPSEWKELGLEGAVFSERDVTDRKRIEERIIRMTYYDLLTGLPNRILFIEKLREALSYVKRRGEMVSVVLIDLARTAEVNTLYGSEAGDKILRKVGERLRSKLRSGDIVSRFFADKFGIALTGIRDTRGLSRALEKVRSAFEEPFTLNGKEVKMEAYMGVSLFPRDGSDPEDLIRKAEIALARARERGPGSVDLYSSEVEEELKQIAAVREDIEKALKEDQIKVFYQPVLDLKREKMVGIEALVRWEHPKLGLLPPSEFISVAEDTGHIVDIGYCVLAKAVRDLSRLHSEGMKKLFVAVNFSMRQFLEEGLTESIEEVLKLFKIPPENFVVEITESTAMKDPERTKFILRSMKELGVKVAIDDFGTGYSSMNYLIEFDVDKIKIDRTFTSAMVENERAKAVVRAIVDLSHSVGAVSLAEGIEGERHLKALKEMGCDEGQGYYFSPPVEFERLRELIIKQGWV